MAPMYGHANYDFTHSSEESAEMDSKYDDTTQESLTYITFWYMIFLIGLLLTWLMVYFCLRIISLRHKTRTPQQRRMYAGNRSSPSSLSPEPTIYVSPSNLPPPPKYDQIAPPSYEEVIGIHYPQYQNQPITAPITTAMAHASNVTENPENDVQSTVITVTSDERRTSVTVARS